MNIEILFYFGSWLFIVFKGCYETYKVAYHPQYLQKYIERGYVSQNVFGLYLPNIEYSKFGKIRQSYIGANMRNIESNKSRFEYMWIETISLLKDGWPYLLTYLLISRFLRKYASKANFLLFNIIITILIHIHLSSFYFVLFEITIFLICALCGSVRSKILVWSFGLLILYNMVNIKQFKFFNRSYLFYLSYANTALLITRAISVGLLMTNSKLTIKLLLECFYFYMYFPALIGCRMMTIRDFIKQIYEPYKINDYNEWIKSIMKVILIFLIWHLIVVLCPFYLVIMSHPSENLNPFILVGGQMFHGLHFYIVYYILYNLVYRTSQLDGYETTKGPVCIAHVSLYTTIWREFDRGLHVWVKDHIFRPIKEYSTSKCFSFIAICATFGFVYIFHGVSINIGIFIAFNLIQYLLENFVKHLFRHEKISDISNNYLSVSLRRRLEGCFCSISFLISVIAFASMQYGYDKTFEIGFYLLYHSLRDFTLPFYLSVYFIYCHGQLSVYVNHK